MMSLIDQQKKDVNPRNTLDLFPTLQARTRTRREPIILMETKELENSRLYWQHCLVRVIMDFRRFLVRTIQRIINRAQRLKDRVIMVGKANNNYVIHFNNAHDLHFIWQHGSWSLKGAFMAMDIWRPNIVLSVVNLPIILIWVQLWGLPLKYQILIVVQCLTQTMGVVSYLD